MKRVRTHVWIIKQRCQCHRKQFTASTFSQIDMQSTEAPETKMIHPPCEARVGAHANSDNIVLKGSHWDISKLNVDHVSSGLLDMLLRLLSQRGSTLETLKS